MIVIVYAERLLYGRPAVWWIVLVAALAAISLAILARLSFRVLDAPLGAARGRGARAHADRGARDPVSVDSTAIRNRVSDAGYVGALPGEEQQLLSAYLLAHQGGARDEVAAESATGIGSLIVKDARPIVVLTSYGARVFTSVAKLKRLIAQGDVRYAFLSSNCGHHVSALNAACSEPARWIRAHGTDVSQQAGLEPRQGAVAAAGSVAMSAGQSSALEALALGARAAGKIALDTEFMGEGRYRTLLCLIQLAIPDGADGSERIRDRRSAGGGSRRLLRWRRSSKTPPSRWSCTPAARTSRSCAGASAPRSATCSTRRSQRLCGDGRAGLL